MCLLTNIAAAELIPFCFGEIINDFNILECVVLARVILIPGSKDENLDPVCCKQRGVLLVHQILLGLFHSNYYLS